MSRPTDSIKRGATLQYSAVVTNQGVPVNLTGWTITSQVRTAKGVLIATIAIAIPSQVGQNIGAFSLRTPTATWPLGTHAWDIAYSYSDGIGGQIVSYTDTVDLVVVLANTV